MQRNLTTYCVGQVTAALEPVRTALVELVQASDQTAERGHVIPACTQKVFDDETKTADAAEWKAIRKQRAQIRALFASFADVSELRTDFAHFKRVGLEAHHLFLLPHCSGKCEVCDRRVQSR